MVIENNSSEKIHFIFTILGIILFGTNALALSNPEHSADEILIIIQGYKMTLQEAVDNLFIQDPDSQPIQDITTNIPKGHSANNIKIYIDSEITLQEAIDNDISFCKDNTPSFNWKNLFFGHNSDEVEIVINNQTMDFQNAINSKKLCPPYTYSWKELGDWTECSASCAGGTQTQTVICQRDDEITVADTFCSGAKPSTTQTCNTQACPTCTDGIQNQGETGIDIGGPCPPFPQSVSSGGYTFTCDAPWRHIHANRWSCTFPKVYSGNIYGSVWSGTRTQGSTNAAAWCPLFGGGFPGSIYANSPAGPNDANNKRALFNGNTWVISPFTYRSTSIQCAT